MLLSRCARCARRQRAATLPRDDGIFGVLKSRFRRPIAAMPKFEKDILKLIPPPPTGPPRGARRIGIHTSTAGGVELAAERAYRLGCNALQVFSSSPRQWKPWELAPSQCATMGRLREQYDLKPLVIHANLVLIIF